MRVETSNERIDFTALESLEQNLGIERDPTLKPSGKKEKAKLGFTRKFKSKEGLEILIGKNRQENLELTFRIAKGNDLWLHLKGRPSSHVVILLPSNRTASLDTLLDAAQLLLHFSSGKDWGATEVDYTFRKFVKKIKNSEEVSYTQNKTLIVKPDQERLKRLLVQVTPSK